MSLRGNTVPPDGCPKGRSTAPAGCAAGSRMTTPRFGISERPWMPPSSCWKSSNFSHEKTLPGRDRQTPAVPGQEAFLTPYLTTVRTGTPGNSGFKSAKKYLIPSVKHRKALQITIKNLVQAFGSKMPGVRVSPLGPNNDNLNYIVQVGNVIGFIISIEMLCETYKGREGPVLVCFIPHAIITFNISLQDHFIGRIVKPE